MKDSHGLEWWRVWDPPRVRYTNLQHLSPRDHYRIAKSKERFGRRPDAITNHQEEMEASLFCGEVGTWLGITWMETNHTPHLQEQP